MGIAPGLATGKPAHSTVLRFLDGPTLASTNVSIAVGTAVTWTDESSNEPHHIVVPAAGATPPPTIPLGGPPSGPTIYDGTTLAGRRLHVLLHSARGPGYGWYRNGSVIRVE